MTELTDPDNERLAWGGKEGYVRGEEGWITDTEAQDGKSGLGELLDLLEGDVPISDAESAIESYRPLAGRMYRPTDSEREYRGDGSSWVQLRSRGPNPEFDSVDTGEVSVSDVLDAPSYPTQADLPANRSMGFIALIEDQNRIYFEGA